ncbi:MAG: aromatic amino acid hydroxylase [Bdellovibrionales bacterium]|nr:aromatic amino acid hydroxylase [Bdellovibrionales bacterium]
MELKTISPTSIKTIPFYKSEEAVENIEKIKEKIPAHLRPFIVEQDTTQYQPIDQAVWRYILRQLKNFLSQNAHSCYLEGLKKTGITVEEIPNIDSMCKKLQEFGWAAVPVSGFIPPAAFMELQSLGILPIASDMRSLDHILYTPAPDIVHEAAGHAPILIDPDFADYLKQYAKVAKNALVSKEDLDQYEAIRELSDIKENPESTPEQIQAAEKRLEQINNSMSKTSEAALLGRMNWWTAEYGLIGSLENPKIYGAGLLSSYGEAKECLKDKVKKLPLTVDCVDYSYDITEPQPQLFVAKSFDHLKEVLQELASRMAYKRGGIFGLEKAIEAETVNTVQLNSGLQISGILVDFISQDDECLYYRFEGPTQLCVGGHELKGHNKEYHSHGFSSPLGYVKGFEDCLSWASTEDLAKLGIVIGERARIDFESGVVVDGVVKSTERTPRRELCMISFTDCTVHFHGRTLFDPSWGVFDMAVGSKVQSVFAGPADRNSYGLTDSFAKKVVPKRTLSEKNQKRNALYQSVRNLRQQDDFKFEDLAAIQSKMEGNSVEDWLLRLELIELAYQCQGTEALRATLIEELQEVKKSHPDKAVVIDDGLLLADQIL